MHWGIRKKAPNKLHKRINDFSEGHHSSWDTKHQFDHNGYLNVNAVSKESARGKLAWKAVHEYANKLGPDGDHDSPKAKKIWKDINKKYKKAYLKAVLKDAKIPINKQTMAEAHKIINSKDTEYSRYR